MTFKISLCLDLYRSVQLLDNDSCLRFASIYLSDRNSSAFEGVKYINGNYSS